MMVGQKGLIVNESGEVLIIRRSKVYEIANTWDIPGGRIEFGESLREAFEREIADETGLELEQVDPPLSIMTFVRGNEENRFQVVRIIYPCKATGEVTLSEEHTEYKWINSSNYKDYTFPDVGYEKVFERLSSYKFEDEESDFLELDTID